MPLFGQKGLTSHPARLSRASLARTSISGPTKAQASYVFDTTLVLEKFPIRCHNPLNVGDRRTGRIHRGDSVRRAHRAVPSGRLQCRAAPSDARVAREGHGGMAPHRDGRSWRLPTVEPWAGLPRSLGDSQWHAAPWGDSGVGRGRSLQGRRANGLRIVARDGRVIRRDRVVVSSD
jgi:hypothetical protein